MFCSGMSIAHVNTIKEIPTLNFLPHFFPGIKAFKDKYYHRLLLNSECLKNLHSYIWKEAKYVEKKSTSKT